MDLQPKAECDVKIRDNVMKKVCDLYDCKTYNVCLAWM